ncbi:hypothetical protein V8G54_000598 [Vigna mungo]|uniref:Uncharacterized protein n=1 Tax=Vigna mungo TaxID=3915 RepID=A0AAQ3SAZ7_VIGMU
MSFPLGGKAWKRPPELALSLLVPSFDHMELFAASPGSSILRVLGIKKFCSELLRISFCLFDGVMMFPFLECFPKMGAETVLLTEDWDDIHDIFQEGGIQLQYAGVV